MATFLANEINATDRDVTGPTEQVQIMLPVKDKNIYMLFTGREVRIGKTCARGLEYGRTRDRGHSFSQYGLTKAGE